MLTSATILMSKLFSPGSLTTAEKEIYSEVGRMKKHVMIGLWSGSKVDFDLLMCQMRDQVITVENVKQ